MGIERTSVSAKLDGSALLFIDTLRRDSLPFDLSRSSAINLSLNALMQLLSGVTVAEKARAMQEHLRNSRNVALPEPMKAFYCGDKEEIA